MLSSLMTEAWNQASQGRDREIVKSMLETALMAARGVAKRHRQTVDAADLKNSIKMLFMVPSVGVSDNIATKIADAIVSEQ